MEKKFWLIAVAFVLLTACETRKKDIANEDKTTTENEDGGNHNLLTSQEMAEGWKLLFNGKDLSGWRFFKNKENNSWEAVDGTLHCKPFDSANQRADVLTVDQYENFELAFDWKIAPQGNSGVMFRVSEQFDEPYFSGPEYQVIDDEGYPGDPLKESQLTGSNYDMHAAPAGKPVNAVGEWNSSKLVVNGQHVEHWLNGVKLLEYELGSPEWNSLKETSKWKDEKGYGASAQGHIDLQDHGTEVWYRNVKIRVLPG